MAYTIAPHPSHLYNAVERWRRDTGWRSAGGVGGTGGEGGAGGVGGTGGERGTDGNGGNGGEGGDGGGDDVGGSDGTETSGDDPEGGGDGGDGVGGTWSGLFQDPWTRWPWPTPGSVGYHARSYSDSRVRGHNGWAQRFHIMDEVYISFESATAPHERWVDLSLLGVRVPADVLRALVTVICFCEARQNDRMRSMRSRSSGPY